MIKYLFTVGLIFVLLECVQGQYEDVRCKCVCPSVKVHNTTSHKVFLKTFSDPDLCRCSMVVDKAVQETEYNFCNKCECKWNRRNTTTIKVVVILIICVVSLLVLYMLFLLCLDPLMARRPKTYIEQHNEEVNLDTQSIQPGGMLEDTTRPRGAIMMRVKHEVSRVRGEQQKWKGTVQEQRRHIYDRHTMLN
ncbi:hypothetical protein LSH36_133g01025 [Paralvinella palmiformis]|uniref:Transmembrane protein 9 n=1 Tax=Paralvinella palmiformis TaxID=53620 RepID=A0AAD9JWJ9_9ANNE|nr:hypothetical protein LSH36_133g01025 [Paralvinella palmiformis]